MNDFDEMEAAWSRAADGSFGEVLVIRPMVGGINTRPSADTSRLAFDVTGIWITEPKETKAGKYTRADNMRTAVSFDQRNLRHNVCQGDHVFRPKTCQTYRVELTRPDGEGRVEFGLQHIAGAS